MVYRVEPGLCGMDKLHQLKKKKFNVFELVTNFETNELDLTLNTILRIYLCLIY